MVFDGLLCFQKPKIAGKCPVLSQRVAGPIDRIHWSGGIQDSRMGRGETVYTKLQHMCLHAHFKREFVEKAGGWENCGRGKKTR